MTQTIETPEPIAQGFVIDALFPELTKRLARINKQAAKVGAEPVRFELTGKEKTRAVKGCMVEDVDPETGESLGRCIHVQQFEHSVEVVIFGEQPKLLGDWTLLGVIDHREKVALVNAVPGQIVPADQGDRGPVCDHCDAQRRRADTFVLQAADGAIVQVGRQCLADFLGLSANNPASVLNLWISTGDLLGGLDEIQPEGSFGFGRAAYRVNILETCVLAGAVTDVNGFVSGSRAYAEGMTSTSSRVRDIIWPPDFNYRGAELARLEYRDWCAKVEKKITPELRAEAALALAWATEQAAKPEPSDFITKLGALVECGTVDAKYLGTVVWIMAGYRKAQDKLRAAEAKTKLWATSEHTGTIGERQEADLTYRDQRVLDGNYGETFLTTFSDRDGNCIKWFASRDIEDDGWELGEERHVKMTVKKHDEFNGVAQTVVNRVASFTAKAAKAL